MLKKRLIGVITVKDGWAVQSFGYRRYLPLGKVTCLAKNLDRWGVDEILVQCIDRTRAGLGPDLALVRSLGALGLATPLIYAGGLSRVADGLAVIEAGADRICVDALLHDDPGEVVALAAHLGSQALIGALPVAPGANGLLWLDYRSGTQLPISGAVLAMMADGVLSEALLIDHQHEGEADGFDPRIARLFPALSPDGATPVILFGGISVAAKIRELIVLPHVSAIAVGNFLNYREHAVQSLKEDLAGLPVRPAVYAGEDV